MFQLAKALDQHFFGDPFDLTSKFTGSLGPLAQGMQDQHRPLLGKCFENYSRATTGLKNRRVIHVSHHDPNSYHEVRTCYVDSALSTFEKATMTGRFLQLRCA